MVERHRNSDLVELGVDEYASVPESEPKKSPAKKSKESSPKES